MSGSKLGSEKESESLNHTRLLVEAEHPNDASLTERAWAQEPFDICKQLGQRHQHEGIPLILAEIAMHKQAEGILLEKTTCPVGI